MTIPFNLIAISLLDLCGARGGRGRGGREWERRERETATHRGLLLQQLSEPADTDQAAAPWVEHLHQLPELRVT